MPQAGIAVAVIEHGKIIHSKGYGKLAVTSDEKVNEHTLFQIASNTKAFTTAGLAILVDQGKLNWNDKVIKHIPEFTMYSDSIRESFDITDLLTHRSGLGLGVGDLMFYPPGSDFMIDDVLNSFQYFKPSSEFRTKYAYDNLLYLVAGEVIHRVSGQPYNEFIENQILNPLGMDRTATSYNRLRSRKNIATAHSTKKGEIWEIERYAKGEGSLAASGGIYSSIHDMSKWLLAQLNQGRYGASLQHKIFTHQRQEEMWTPYTFVGYVSGARHYGLGWYTSDINGYSVISHSGGLPGMLSLVMMVPELKSAIVVLTNASPGGNSYHSISWTILGKWIGKEGRDYLTSAQRQISAIEAFVDTKTDEIWNTATVSSVEELKANAYLGTYEDSWFGKVTIENRGNRLWFQSERSPHLNGEMFLYKKDTFAVKMSYTNITCDAIVLFERNDSGKIERIKMKGISPTIDFSFDYQDLNLIRLDR
ncbi:MAG: serine hydrolase [Roseivirga sp.]|nr:serine hydrolase [Roseivirga sp.]